MTDWIPWGGVFLLGAYHGLNPAMGWLFALALGLQERRRRALLQALVPIGIGHFLAVGAVALLLTALPNVLPLRFVRGGIALVLAGFGVFRLVRARHPRWVGLRVGFRDLVLWSTLMASSHGAGLMLSPFLLGPFCVVPGQYGSGGLDPAWLLSLRHSLRMVGAHTLGYLLTMALVAWIAYEGGRWALLRQAWVNLDLLWAFALMATALFSFLL